MITATLPDHSNPHPSNASADVLDTGTSRIFQPDPAESGKAMIQRLTGRDLSAPREPGARVLDSPPYPMPAAEIGRQLARMYPDQVRVSYGSPMAYYWLDASEPAELHLNYEGPAPEGFPPLPDETAEAYFLRIQEADTVAAARWSRAAKREPILPTVADARALESQDPRHVMIDFHGRVGGVMRAGVMVGFVFPEALRDMAGAEVAA